MRRKANKEFIIMIILIPLFLVVIFILSKYRGGAGYDYSVSGKGLSGYSIIYEAMNDVGFSAVKGNTELKKGVSNDLNVITASQNFNIDDENLKEWINSGGSMLVLSPGGKFEVPYGSGKEKINDNLILYSYGQGRIITADSDSLTNVKLAKDTEGAYGILNYLLKSGYKKVIFNEYYLYPSGAKLSLWKDTPYGIKLVLYQCILVAALYIFMKGKRFGMAIVLREEVERTENEYIYSAASLFKKAGCYDIMLESYLNSLFHDIKKTLKLYGEVTVDNFADIWERENLPGLNIVRTVQNDIKGALESKNKKQCIRAASGMEELMDILKNRREFQWKQIKSSK